MRRLQTLLSALAMVGLLSSGAWAEDRFDRLVKEVERIRTLSFKQRIPWEMRTPQGMSEQFREEADEEAPSADDKALSLFLHRLGLVPKGFDLTKFLLTLYSEEIRGLYDPRSKTFFVVGEEQAASPDQFTLEEVVAVHELQHALQDQHFDLVGYQNRMASATGSDEVLAARSLVEGEAELVATDFVLGASGMTSSQIGSQNAQARTSSRDLQGAMAAAPLYFRRLLSFPYTTGLDLVLHVRKAGGWELVSRMYEDPPASTEQVMHPERYLDRRDFPVRVALNLPSQLGGYSLLAEDVGGEFMASVFLEDHLGYQASLSPAKGWGGDVFRVYTRGNEDMALWFLHWDSLGEAGQFARAAKEAFARAGIEDAVVEKRDQDVVLYLGVPTDLREEIARNLERVTLDPVERRILVKRPEVPVAVAVHEVEPEVKENRYLMESNRFVSLTHGFVLPVPQGWVPRPNNDLVILPVMVMRLDGNAQAMVHVVRLPRDASAAPPTEKEQAEDLMEEILSAFPGARLAAVRQVPGRTSFLEVETVAGRERVSAFRGEALGRTYSIILRADARTFPAARKELVGDLKGMSFGKPGEF